LNRHLWVGINFALALGEAWNIPVMPTNHMEGHIVSPLISASKVEKVIFPALALLISGGHTELVSIEAWNQYKVIGQTRDDAVGEAFDKVARLLNLPYPGGPEISKLAAQLEKKIQTTLAIATPND
jgi:N6-L-threonylcarbamoyladenine synthase